MVQILIRKVDCLAYFVRGYTNLNHKTFLAGATQF